MDPHPVAVAPERSPGGGAPFSDQADPRKECVECGGRFVPRREWQETCSQACRKDRWERLNPRVRDLLEALSPATRAECEALLQAREHRPPMPKR